MIIEYDENGRIFHIVNDPVPAGLSETYVSMGKTFLNMMPVPWPETPQFDPNGQPVINPATGMQMMASDGSDPVQVDIVADYVLDGEITPRPIFNVPDRIELVAGEDSVTLALPDPCTVILDGETRTIEGGELEISSPMPARYSLELSSWPYLEKTVEVEVI